MIYSQDKSDLIRNMSCAVGSFPQSTQAVQYHDVAIVFTEDFSVMFVQCPVKGKVRTYFCYTDLCINSWLYSHG